MTTTCPRCNAPLDRSDRLVEGAMVERCRACGMYRVVGNPRWVQAGPHLIATLRLLAAEQELEDRRYRDMLESDISDPRWTRLN